MDKKIHNILKGKVIGLSVSQSEDIFKLGYGDSHLQDAKIELARYLLSCGCIMAYGGDLRPNGFTKILFDLVEAYSPLGEDSQKNPYLISYLAWPTHADFPEKEEAKLSNKISVVKLGLPADITGNLRPKDYLIPDTLQKFYIWARSMTTMREIMNKACDARIVFGGMMTEFKGKYPGVVEEVLIAMRMKKPVFILGAFGGASKDIAGALTSDTVERLSEDYQFKHKSTLERTTYFNAHKPPSESEIDYNKLTQYFKNQGIPGLNNGLSDEENKTLFETPHFPEMIALIIKGLVKKFNS